MRVSKVIYFDNNATTSISNDVYKSMIPYLTSEYGNPSSTYHFGNKNKVAINDARKSIADMLSCLPEEIMFTSGGSESNCAAILSCIKLNPTKKKIVTSSVEHASIMETMAYLEKIGYIVKYAPVNSSGNIDMEYLKKEIDDTTCLVSIMFANNEIGCIYDISSISKLARNVGTLFHTDAVQGFGKTNIDINTLDVDFLSLSGHKFHAPKGIGALYIKKGTPFEPLVFGHQERGMRGGTENVASIVGIGVAAHNAKANLDSFITKTSLLHEYFEKKISETFPEVMIHGKQSKRLTNTCNFSFPAINGEEIVMILASKGICVSTGSACNSVSIEPSYVLTAMNVPKDYLRSIRVSFSDINTIEEIDYFIKQLKFTVDSLKKLKGRM